jgi:hypothetical protein
MQANKDITQKQYSINGNSHIYKFLGALLTILQNKVATNSNDSDVLLFGSDIQIHHKKTDDRQESYTHTDNLICTIISD